MIQPRCSSGAAMLRRRTSPHSGAKAGAGRSQLRSQAFQASCRASASKPGSSLQATGTQRLLDWVSVPGTATGALDAGRADGLVGTGGSNGTGVEQAASIPTINAIKARRGRRTFMGLILLEALVALLIFVGILWWTMFSGRKRGELPPEENDDRGPEK